MGTQAKPLLSLALTNMMDEQLQPSKGHSKGVFKGVKKWLRNLISGFSSRSTSPQPASEQENQGVTCYCIIGASIDRPYHWRFGCSKPARYYPSVVPWIKHSVQHADHHTPAQLSRSQPSSSNSDLSESSLDLWIFIDQPDTVTQDSAGLVHLTQPHGMSTQHSSPNCGCILTA